MTAKKGVFAAAVAISLLALAAPARAELIPEFGKVGDDHVYLPPFVSANHAAPRAAATPVGDIDGDGLEDVAVALDSYEPASPSSVWVSFAAAELPATANAGTPGWRGFRIVGPQLTVSVTGMPDVNGDSLREVVVHDSGTSSIYVVFGRTDGATVNAAELGNAGYRITGVDSRDYSCFGQVSLGMSCVNTSMVAIGDLTGDGKAELAYADGNDVKVAYTPFGPAGETVNGDGAPGFTL
jgi:hypothetical protein